MSHRRGALPDMSRLRWERATPIALMNHGLSAVGLARSQL